MIHNATEENYNEDVLRVLLIAYPKAVRKRCSQGWMQRIQLRHRLIEFMALLHCVHVKLTCECTADCNVNLTLLTDSLTYLVHR